MSIKVAVIYHQFPHYRAPVLRSLSKSNRYEYIFWASVEDFSGIKAFKGDSTVSVNPLNTQLTKRGFRVNGYSAILKDRSIDAFLILGNPNILATWLIACFGRLTGKKVLFWAHGWLRQESSFKMLLRNSYFRLSHFLLVYGERSKSIGVTSGYPSERIHVIYNSLDFERAEDIFGNMFPEPQRPLLICTARLTDQCRFDILIAAAETLKQRGKPVNILLVGEGPARNSLERLASKLEVDVYFYGACYDEITLGRLIYDADATVSPGKIGLTAIHSLTYGTPAFTHGDMDRQMPEVEAITPGISGDFFSYGDSNDLADTLQRWFDTGRDRAEIRRCCHSVIAQKWNPTNQRILIEKALDACFEGVV
jgi:glycosyltransferase involved in cell wall biosynthesis